MGRKTGFSNHMSATTKFASTPIHFFFLKSNGMYVWRKVSAAVFSITRQCMCFPIHLHSYHIPLPAFPSWCLSHQHCSVRRSKVYKRQSFHKNHKWSPGDNLEPFMTWYLFNITIFQLVQVVGVLSQHNKGEYL